MFADDIEIPVRLLVQPLKATSAYTYTPKHTHMHYTHIHRENSTNDYISIILRNQPHNKGNLMKRFISLGCFSYDTQ